MLKKIMTAKGSEEPVSPESGEGKKGMFKLSSRCASKLPEGSISPTDLC